MSTFNDRLDDAVDNAEEAYIMVIYTILWSRGGSHDGVDWDDEQTVTFDAGLKVTAIHPGAGNHGVFSDIADRMLMGEAQDWIENEGYDEAVKLLAA